jgi:hypothetical protein
MDHPRRGCMADLAARAGTRHDAPCRSFESAVFHGRDDPGRGRGKPKGGGLDPALPRLFIIDGSKALSKAIRAAFGRRRELLLAGLPSTPANAATLRGSSNITTKDSISSTRIGARVELTAGHGTPHLFLSRSTVRSRCIATNAPFTAANSAGSFFPNPIRAAADRLELAPRCADRGFSPPARPPPERPSSPP